MAQVMADELARACAPRRRNREAAITTSTRAYHDQPRADLPTDKARAQRANDLPGSPTGGSPQAGTPLFGRQTSRPLILDNIPHNESQYARDIIAAAKGNDAEISR